MEKAVHLGVESVVHKTENMKHCTGSLPSIHGNEMRNSRFTIVSNQMRIVDEVFRCLKQTRKDSYHVLNDSIAYGSISLKQTCFGPVSVAAAAVNND
ncbi:unnamed protein product [Soboliphyme baturini]|uniref:Transposase n=1 Tax=Soboliphyme baturini TaxID=241478 RepID=A0A183IYN9_9BILA|nr:unnamed protein product [Soboliphyme baturini]